MAIISNAVTIADAGAFSVSLGSLVHIKTLTASSSATLSFVNGAASVVLDSTYPIYVFKIISSHPQTDGAVLSFQVSTDTGSNYAVTVTSAVFDAEHSEGDASSFSYGGSRDQAQGTAFQDLTMNNTSSDSDNGTVGILMLFNPASTTFAKHFIFTGCSINTGDYLSYDFAAGYFNTTSAIDAIQFKMVEAGGNIDAGTFKLYGFKDS